MTQVTFKLKKVDDRYYFNDGEKYVLIDTGYGRTVSYNGKIGPYHVDTQDTEEMWRFNPTFMHDGTQIGGFLCPLNGYSCLLKGDSVTIDDNAQELPEHEWFIPFVPGRAPHVQCKVDGKQKELFFDSGMRLPVLCDNSLVKGKKKLGNITEWIAPLPFRGLAEAPFYTASFDFTCGFHFDGHFEYDALNFVAKWQGDGFLGIEFFTQYDLFISAIPGKGGIAVIKR